MRRKSTGDLINMMSHAMRVVFNVVGILADASKFGVLAYVAAAVVLFINSKHPKQEFFRVLAVSKR